jgi:predicted dienelactone hydrolase
MFSRKVLLLLLFVFTLFPLSNIHAQPMINFPAFTGQYKVGKVDYYLQDHTRTEIFTADPNDQRELLITVYYPVDLTVEGQVVPYVEGALKAILSEGLEIDSEMWDLVDTGMLTNVPAAEGRYPVLIFMPGLGTLPLFYSSMLAELASQGYVVAASWHPYSTDITVFPNERVVMTTNTDSPLDRMNLDEMSARRAELIEVWVGDAIFVLDQLTRMNDADVLLANHLDLAKVGVFGHSFGGASAAQAAYQDDRFLAVANLDGTMSGAVAENGITQPFMMLQTQDEISGVEPTDEQLAALGLTREEYLATSEVNIVQRLSESSDAGYIVTLRQAAHNTYATDFLIFAPFFPERINEEMIGALNAEQALITINDYLGAFFAKHIKGEDERQLSSLYTKYPEIIFTESSSQKP